MADRDESKHDAEGGESKRAPKPTSPVMLVIIGAVALFVAILGAQVAAPILTNMISGAHAPAKPAAEGEEEELALADSAPVQQVETPKGPALYVPLDPPFVVSFTDDNGDTRFLQLTLQAMAREERTVQEIKTHGPAIRNAFLFLISGYKVEELTTLAGKEKLRGAMLEAANDIMAKNAGAARIDELFFTSLVIQ
jgi:flagellar FliL protein